MRPLKISVTKILASLRESRSVNSLGPAGVVLGIILVALGWILEEESVGMGGSIRTLGGILLLCGLAVIMFGDSHRRAVAIGMSKRIYGRYMSRTAHWNWPDRVGLAGVVIGVVLIVPAVILQIIFRNGAIVAGPAVVLFWFGVFLLIYGRFHGRNKKQDRGLSSSLPDRNERGRRRV